MEREILERIGLINKYYPNPQCYLVALLLGSWFKGDIYYNSNHFITKIGDRYYDKTGEVVPDSTTGPDQPYLPLGLFGWDVEVTCINAMVEKHRDNLPDTPKEKSEYRTPNIDEFVEGFEYEVCNMTTGGYVVMGFKGDGTAETVRQKDPDIPVWVIMTYTEKDPYYKVSKTIIETQLEEGRIRVKRQ